MSNKRCYYLPDSTFTNMSIRARKSNNHYFSCAIDALLNSNQIKNRNNNSAYLFTNICILLVFLFCWSSSSALGLYAQYDCPFVVVPSNFSNSCYDTIF